MFAGSPQAPGYFDGEIKLIRELVSHPGYTLPVRVRGNELADLGINHDDILVGSRYLTPTPGSTVIVLASTGLFVKHLSGLWLVSSLPKVIAVATHVIHKL